MKKATSSVDPGLATFIHPRLHEARKQSRHNRVSPQQPKTAPFFLVAMSRSAVVVYDEASVVLVAQRQQKSLERGEVCSHPKELSNVIKRSSVLEKDKKLKVSSSLGEVDPAESGNEGVISTIEQNRSCLKSERLCVQLENADCCSARESSDACDGMQHQTG